MRINSINVAQESQSRFYLVVIFVAALFPFSINIGGDGISANYIFILFPLFVAVRHGGICLPVKGFRDIIVVYVVVFCIATLYQLSYLEHIDRRIASFILFMSVFSYMSIKVDCYMMASFKVAIVVISVVLSLTQLSIYFVMGGSDLGFAAKDVVGSQRYGFIYIIALWILFLQNSIGWRSDFVKYICILLIVCGLLLTFSRSGIVALMGSFGLYVVYNARAFLKHISMLNKTTVIKLLYLLIVLVGAGIVAFEYIYVTLDFYQARLFSLVNASGENVYDLADPEASEGYRVYMLRKIFEYVMYNPFTGSGYLGVWVMFADRSGSAHNQLTDVLFRTGIFGFIAYCILLFRLLSFLFVRDSGLFWGMVGVIIYGFFHETFKESQGAFVLAFLLGALSSDMRQGNRAGRRVDGCPVPGVAKSAISTPLNLK